MDKLDLILNQIEKVNQAINLLDKWIVKNTEEINNINQFI